MKVGIITELLTGLFFGALFGFLLQRGHVLRFEKQVNMLRFKDMTVLKFMLSAALVGMVGRQLAVELSYDLEPVPFFGLAIIIGGFVYGLGWAIVGYCPGTLLGAMGEGRIDAYWAFLGSWVGAFAYIWIHPFCQRYVNPVLAIEIEDLPVLLGVSPWLFIALFGVICVALFWWLEKRGV